MGSADNVSGGGSYQLTAYLMDLTAWRAVDVEQGDAQARGRLLNE